MRSTAPRILAVCAIWLVVGPHAAIGCETTPSGGPRDGGMNEDVDECIAAGFVCREPVLTVPGYECDRGETPDPAYCRPGPLDFFRRVCCRPSTHDGGSSDSMPDAADDGTVDAHR